MLKRLFLKKMFKKQLASVPEAEQDKLFTMVEQNPELFKKIADEVQQKVKAGGDQMAATMEVMQKYQSELQALTQSPEQQK